MRVCGWIEGLSQQGSKVQRHRAHNTVVDTPACSRCSSIAHIWSQTSDGKGIIETRLIVNRDLGLNVYHMYISRLAALQQTSVCNDEFGPSKTPNGQMASDLSLSKAIEHHDKAVRCTHSTV